MKTVTKTAPMQMQGGNRPAMFPIEGMRLLDGPTAEELAAQEAARVAAAAEAEAAAAAKVIADAAAAKVIADAAAAAIVAEAAEAKRIEDEKKAGKLTDKEYEFLTDTLKHKKTAREAQAALAEATNKLASFDGIDPEKIKALIASEAAAQTAKDKAEREAVEKSGDVARIKEMMAADHKRVVDELNAKAQTVNADLSNAQKTIEDLTVGSAFSQSDYVNKELVLPPAMARQVYGSHFDVVKGKIVPFNKPRGETGRTELVDASGISLSVDVALKKLIEASPDRDKILRSKIAPGAGSRTETGSGVDKTQDGLRGMARIQAGLDAGQLKKPGTK